MRNRGKEGNDDYLFGELFMQAKMKEAVYDMSFLLERGYGAPSSCKLVGNRYRLHKRQQQAMRGMSAGNTSVINRLHKEVSVIDLSNQTLIIDGFNQIILLESMLSEAYLFKGKDGVYRDLSTLYGTYKSVKQTQTAIKLIANFSKLYRIGKIIWVLDKPISNSGRMKTLLTAYAEEKDLNWEVLLENNPDKIIAESKYIGVTSDAWILESVSKWFNLIAHLIPKEYPSLVMS
ncbi:DUF434 domain-containing protein [Tenacibaculum maritimum]|nr:DUF434 domain-containing protein [Tenacibaculum maritimum]MDB0612106.1 DUF434 domain-containing protein [Tenacibaculum maritimum]